MMEGMEQEYIQNLQVPELSKMRKVKMREEDEE